PIDGCTHSAIFRSFVIRCFGQMAWHPMNKAGILVDDSNAAADRCRPRWSLVGPAARVPWVEPGSRSRLPVRRTGANTFFGGRCRYLHG
ncbi:hypothetical protein, partial [Delftia acidovorans]|uniref:hypothetical protein n=1 Tax=Delftia acidovorans TaxID=80866 RepID=UPI0035A07368